MSHHPKLRHFFDEAKEVAERTYHEQFVHRLLAGVAKVIVAEIEQDFPDSRPVVEIGKRVARMTPGERNAFFKHEGGRIVQCIRQAAIGGIAKQLAELDHMAEQAAAKDE